MKDLQNRDPMFEKAEIIVRATQELGEVINNFHADTPLRWDILEKVVTAHKTLRNLDLLAFLQPPLTSNNEEVKAKEAND